MARKARERIGWREWVSLPDLGIEWIKAKVDTGARTSALHAFGLDFVTRDGIDCVRFVVHPIQRDHRETVEAVLPVVDERQVTSSSGHRSLRPVVSTRVRLAGRTWPIELTLTNRDEMGFRMLLGRSAVRRRFLVDPGASFVTRQKPDGVRP